MKSTDLKAISELYGGVKAEFENFKKQILAGNYEEVDAWCDSLVNKEPTVV